jgi:predicted dehydrogenase
MSCGGAVLGASVLPTASMGWMSHGKTERYRAGIVGSTGKGDYGHGVDVAFSKISALEIVALADADDAGREKAVARTHPQRAYSDYREMFAKEKLHVVAICPRWIDQHHDMIIAAAQADCHIYMEKPFCPTLEQCDSAINELKKKNLKLAIAHTAQYSPVLEVVLSLIKRGEIGEILELRARGKEDQRGGAEDLWVLGSHVLGLMRTLSGGDAMNCSAIVTANGRRIAKSDVRDGAEGIGPLAGDFVSATYSFPNGVMGHFSSRRGTGGSPSRFGIQVFGSKGIIEMESGYLTRAHILRDSSWSPGRSGKAWESITSAGIGKTEPRTDGSYEGGHIAAITDLLDSIQKDRAPKCSAEDARKIVEMIAAVFESSRIGGPVDLPLKNRVNPFSLLP